MPTREKKAFLPTLPQFLFTTFDQTPKRSFKLHKSVICNVMLMVKQKSMSWIKIEYTTCWQLQGIPVLQNSPGQQYHFDFTPTWPFRKWYKKHFRPHLHHIGARTRRLLICFLFFSRQYILHRDSKFIRMGSKEGQKFFWILRTSRTVCRPALEGELFSSSNPGLSPNNTLITEVAEDDIERRL